MHSHQVRVDCGAECKLVPHPHPGRRSVQTHFLRNVPLQPGGVRNVRVGVALAVPVLCVAQLKGVSGQDVLSQKERYTRQVRRLPRSTVLRETNLK